MGVDGSSETTTTTARVGTFDEATSVDPVLSRTEEETERWLLHKAEMALFGPPGAVRSTPTRDVGLGYAAISVPDPGRRSAMRGGPGDANSAPKPLEISIGRIDVVAPPPPPRRRPRLLPQTSLNDYLGRRREVIP